MDVRSALKRQQLAALAMMRQAVTDCPDEVWLSGQHPRQFWRIAYHAAAYFHLYLYESVEAWAKWPQHRLEATWLEGDVPEIEPYSREEFISFLDLIREEIEPRIDALDLSDPHCGFTWYPKVTRVELLILSLRHFHGHLGQLHEILLASGVDVTWRGQLEQPE